MINEIHKIPFVWCLKRCCWLHIIHKNYQNIICTSANQLGKAKYNIYLIVNGKKNKELNYSFIRVFIDTDSNGTVVYDEPKIHNHNQTNDFHLIRKIRENPGITPMIISTDVKYVYILFKSLFERI
jgi:replication initiation and membrane attachment protein DnaB